MNAPQFKIKKRVTNVVLQIKPNEGDRFFKFHKPMKLGEKLDDQKAAAMLLEATDLVTGEYGVIIVPTILQNDLNKHYPDSGYVGKCFCVNVTRNSAKRYNHVSLAEIDDPQDAAEAEAASQVAAETSVEVSDEAVAAAVASGEGAEPSDVTTESQPSNPAQGRQGKRHR